MYHGIVEYALKAMDKLLYQEPSPSENTPLPKLVDNVTTQNLSMATDINTTDMKQQRTDRLPSTHASVQTVLPYDETMLNDAVQILITQLRENKKSINLRHGYQYMDKIDDTLQGELFKARVRPTLSLKLCQSDPGITRNRNIKIKLVNVNSTHLPRNTLNKESFVIIKKTNKRLHRQGISMKDADNLVYCVQEDILKEAHILRYLTVHHDKIGLYIGKFVRFFSTETDYYLVMEYFEHSMNFKEFIDRSHQFMIIKKMKYVYYRKVIKHLFWQLFIAMHWLHADIKC